MKEEESTGERDRRPYERPRVVESGDFERLVLTCLHQFVGQPGCTAQFDFELKS